MVTKKHMGKYRGVDVFEFILEDGGLAVSVMEYGATIRTLYFAGMDCVRGYDTLEGYVQGGSFQGATVGRYANRIGGAAFALNGRQYQLEKNNGENHLHGGSCGFAHRLFQGTPVGENAVRFALFSPDGEGGYPGNLAFFVTFSVENDTLFIVYHATCDRDTVVNFTNHTYFHLGAPDNRSIVLRIRAEAITPLGAQLVPTGDYLDVTGTPFDFRTAKPIGQDIARCNGWGYDHNFVLGLDRTYREDVATAYCPQSGIVLTLATDMPGLQLYTAETLQEPCGKGGLPLANACAFCLETQFFPDTPNQPRFPSCVLHAGERFVSQTAYRFTKASHPHPFCAIMPIENPPGRE